MPEAGGRGAFTCMHVRGRGPAEAEAGRTGRDRGRVKHVLCKDEPAKVSKKGKREDRPPHAHSKDGIYGVTFARVNAHTCINMHVALSWHVNERLFNNNYIPTAPKFTQV
eukprot:364604-Chlamydomonas_euryale.AAC.10